eukprot:scaffold101420_cov28-Tisochrysis_lutea.AAC.1
MLESRCISLAGQLPFTQGWLPWLHTQTRLTQQAVDSGLTSLGSTFVYFSRHHMSSRPQVKRDHARQKRHVPNFKVEAPHNAFHLSLVAFLAGKNRN